MAKKVDISSKRLIDLAPTSWVRWLTGDATLEVLDMPSGEFQWLSRASDVVIRVESTRDGVFLVINEVQLRPDKQMALRIRVYSALAEERYQLPVYPVVVNILPPQPGVGIASHYHSNFRGLVAHQDFKVINLWEVDANLAFTAELAPLLPFTPILKGGGDEATVKKALHLMRAKQDFAELESLLAFFASFALELQVIQRIMRWDMAVIRESPWYHEILQEGVELGMEQGIEQGMEQGIEQGIEQGRRQELEEMLRHLLEHRFSAFPVDISDQLAELSIEQLRQVVDYSLDAPSLPAVEAFCSKLVSSTRNGNHNGS